MIENRPKNYEYHSWLITTDLNRTYELLSIFMLIIKHDRQKLVIFYGNSNKNCRVFRPIHTERQRLRHCQFFLDASNGFYGNKLTCSHGHMCHCDIDLNGDVM